MINILLSGNKKVFDGALSELISITNKTKEPINCYIFTMSLTRVKPEYVAIEDERFYSHKGVDVKRTGAAIFSYVLHFGSSSYGGSTITQQLVKNFTGDSTDSITRKTREWWKAFQLEISSSKDEFNFLNPRSILEKFK